jgi:hypothetical protein
VKIPRSEQARDEQEQAMTTSPDAAPVQEDPEDLPGSEPDEVDPDQPVNPPADPL